MSPACRDFGQLDPRWLEAVSRRLLCSDDSRRVTHVPASYRAMKFIQRHWFLISLFATLALGAVWAEPLAGLANAKLVRNMVVMATLFLVTLPIDSRRISASFRRPGPALLATVVSYGLLPLLAWLCSGWLTAKFGLGLLVCASAPSTIASAAVWTRRAGGNEMVPIFVTLITNLLCFAVMPMWLSISFGRHVEGISFADMAWKLALLVVLPMVSGQLARRSYRVATWSTENALGLSIVAQIGVLTIVLLGAIQCGLFLRQQQSATTAIVASLPLLLVVLLGLNLIAFFAGKWSASWLSFTDEDAVGVGFAGSQKTLMVGLQVAFLLGGGVVIIPMVLYHALQLIVGTVLADQIANRRRSIDRGGPRASADSALRSE